MTTAPQTPADDAFEEARGRYRADEPALVGLTLRLEEDARLDAAVDALRPAADALVAEPTRRDALLGKVMGLAEVLAPIVEFPNIIIKRR